MTGLQLGKIVDKLLLGEDISQYLPILSPKEVNYLLDLYNNAFKTRDIIVIANLDSLQNYQ